MKINAAQIAHRSWLLDVGSTTTYLNAGASDVDEEAETAEVVASHVLFAALQTGSEGRAVSSGL
jgi:hypothetical protein